MGDRPAPHAQPVEPLPAPNPKAAARVIQGEAMILTPHDSVLHTLNPVATRVWELLGEHRQLDALVEAIVSEFEVAPETARADVEQLIGELTERQILV